ncbi:MAG TPA: glycosyltransferase [Mucilaginibacter sp.]|nr:glycosyltransferase [Mucilaginibacter sp.]
MANVKLGMSVIVCCYNSAARLPATIRHLAAQIFENEWEIILVDNNSSDDTVAVAQQEFDKYKNGNLTPRIVSEVRRGLNYARQKGVDAAKYSYIIFCDDDNWLAENYVAIAFDLIKNNVKIGAIGGLCLAEPEPGVAVPDWFDAYKNNYAIGRQADQSGDVTRRGYLWGAGLITTKAIFELCINTNFPFLLTDRNGESLSSGGDTEFCSRIILSGHQLYYDERLVLKHFIPGNRLTESYLERLIAGINSAHIPLSKYYNLINADLMTRGQKAATALKSTLKIALSPFTKRWNFNQERQLLYAVTGINLGVDKDFVMLMKFKNAAFR